MIELLSISALIGCNLPHPFWTVWVQEKATQWLIK